MSDRIHRHLDGELPLSALSDRERAEVQAYRRVLQETLDPILSEEAPDVTAAVMAQLRPLAHGVAAAPDAGPLGMVRALGRWLWTPRPLRLDFRPAWAVPVLAAALILAPRVLSAPPRGTPIQAGGTVMAASIQDGRALVAFRLDAPGAHTVRLAGDFTGWESGPALTEVSPGIWSVVVPLEVGLHDYAFVVDGTRWVQDPLAEHVDDGFGGSNSRVAVLPPGGGTEA